MRDDVGAELHTLVLQRADARFSHERHSNFVPIPDIRSTDLVRNEKDGRAKVARAEPGPRILVEARVAVVECQNQRFRRQT